MQEFRDFGCPFCGVALAVVRRDLGESQDTGGYGTLTEFRCGGCKAFMTHFVHDKVMWRRDEWRLDEAAKPLSIESTHARAEFPVYSCIEPGCDGDLLAAVPPVTTDDVPPQTRFERSISFLCERCGALYLRFEKGTWADPIVTGWNVLESVKERPGARLMRYVPVSRAPIPRTTGQNH